jgi:hypothetical protein
MNTRIVNSAMAASLLVLGWVVAGSASADVITCNTDPLVQTSDATAQGTGEAERIADDCAYFTGTTDPTSETTAVNSVWGTDDPFIFVGKRDSQNAADDEIVAGWEFNVFELAEGGVEIDGVTYYFGYELIALDPIWQGETIDWVLGLKDGAGPAEGGLAAYLWESITLDLEGKFMSFFRDPEDFSHASGFVRLANGDTPPFQVPEPSIIALFGLGLLGIGWALRRRRQA